MINDKEYTITMKRIDLVNLMIACTSISQKGYKKYERIHDELKRMIEILDEENKDEE